MTGQNEKAAEAVCGAYMLVAFADAQYAQSEEDRFLATAANEPELAMIDSASLQAAYNVLIAAFRDGYAGAAAKVLAAIADVKDDAALAEAVKLAARRAIVADEKLMPQEEAALDHVALALGLEKGDV